MSKYIQPFVQSGTDLTSSCKNYKTNQFSKPWKGHFTDFWNTNLGKVISKTSGTQVIISFNTKFHEGENFENDKVRMV